MDESNDGATLEPAAKKPDPTQKWVTAGIVALLAICVISIAVKSSGLSKPDPTGACHEWIKAQLKAPSTADFTDEPWDVDGDVYTATGSVDAQNSFGAKLRSRYVCKARDVDGSWSRISVTVG